MKKLVLATLALGLGFTGFSQVKKDTTKKTTTVEVPLEFKSDTSKYARILYVDNKLVKADSATIIASGYGNAMFQGFFKENPKIRIFVGGKEIKQEDFLQVVKQ